MTSAGAAATILGIDPGTRVTGYGVICAGRTRSQIVSLEQGVITLPVKLSLSERLGLLHRELLEVIRRHRPTVMAVEELIFAKNPTSALKLGHARGVVLLAAVQHGMSVHSYLPNRVKLAVVGHGHAKKEQVQQMVKMICGLSELPATDAADALAVAICHYHVASSLLTREVLR